jgi:hypothetical protein
VVEQFHVEQNPLFLPDGRSTFCNAFISCVSRALGCEIPHFVPFRVDPDTGMWIFKEMTASAMGQWLDEQGPANGWRLVGTADVRPIADSGGVVVASFRNPVVNLPGHIAICMPSPEGGPVHIAQAGRENYEDATLAMGFGSAIYSTRFYAHP